MHGEEDCADLRGGANIPGPVYWKRYIRGKCKDMAMLFFMLHITKRYFVYASDLLVTTPCFFSHARPEEDVFFPI
jgi:hypothetical protein